MLPGEIYSYLNNSDEPGDYSSASSVQRIWNPPKASRNQP